MTQAFDKALPVIIAISEGIKASFGGIVEDVRKVFDSFKTVLSGIGTFFKGVFTGDKMALGGFKTACTGVLDTIGNIFKGRINIIKNFVVAMFLLGLTVQGFIRGVLVTGAAVYGNQIIKQLKEG